ncbi:MAG: Two component regulator, sensor protein [Verrucomicrobiales bacterium]|nr:Two component regulator, sensor protein [Verrucomicrobiales bacterium]
MASGQVQDENSDYVLRFDGDNDFVRVDHPINLANSSFTIEFWARRQKFGSTDFIMSQGSPQANQFLHIGFREDGVFTFAFWQDDLDTPRGYGDTSWHHWACTYDVSNRMRRIYRDGNLIAGQSANANFQGRGTMMIGTVVPGLPFFYRGELKDFRVWKVARNQADIIRHMSLPITNSTPGLLLNFPLNASSGFVAEDVSGNGNDGNLKEGPSWVRSTVPLRVFTREKQLVPEGTDGGKFLSMTNTMIEAPIRRSDFVMRSWTTEDGLPQNVVESIDQTPDGYLWFGTLNGLVRFDGVRFKVFDAANTPQLRSSRISKVYVDRKGRLWVLSEFGDVASYFDGEFHSYGSEAGVPQKGFKSLAEDSAGNLFAGSRSYEGCFRFQNDKFNQIISETNKMAATIHSMAMEADGTMWGIQTVQDKSAETLVQLSPGMPHEVAMLPEEVGSRILGMSSSRDGGLWLLSARGLYYCHGGRAERLFYSPEPMAYGSAIMEDRHGHVWMGTAEQGLMQFDQRGTILKFILDDSSPLADVRTVFEDREGNIWIGLGGGGLRLLRPRVFTTYDSRDGLDGDEVKSVSEDLEGDMWVVARSRADKIHRLRVTISYEPGPRMRSNPQAVIGDREGRVWVASRESGLFRHDTNSITRILAELAGTPYGPVASGLFLTKSNVLYLAGSDKLFTVDDGVLKSSGPLADLDAFDIRAMAENSKGGLFLGLNGRGLLYKQLGLDWKRFTSKDGLPSESVWSLYADSDDDIWIGTTGNGLSRLHNGKFFNFPAESGSLPRFINSILEDDKGFLWLGSNQGIFRVARSQLIDVAEGRSSTIFCLRYSSLDGLGTSECTSGFQPSAWKAHDGRLWFATVKGVSVVNPNELPFNPMAPPVIIEEVSMDGQPHSAKNGLAGFGKEETVVVPAGSTRLEIHYTSLSLTASEKSQFKFRLESLDNEWQDVGNRRTAYFTRVPPGKYHFQVTACNNDGVWNEEGASLSLVVLPYYWQTGWFRTLAISFVSGLIIWGYNRRVNTLKRERSAQEHFSRRLIESQEQERKRISSGLHDGLGQSLLHIRNQATMGRDRPALDPASQFQAISDAALHAINEVRTIAYDLRPYELDRLGLTKAIESAAQKASDTSGFKTHIELDLIDDLLPSEFEISLYRIVQEALTNAVKHSQATTLYIQVKAELDSVQLVVEDDGRGGAAGVSEISAERKGMGLESMTERVKIMGGRFSVESNSGNGTRIVVIIPLTHRERTKPD